jgi:hypothetical protein
MLLAGHGYLVGKFVGQRSSKWNAVCSRGTLVSVSLGCGGGIAVLQLHSFELLILL